MDFRVDRGCVRRSRAFKSEVDASFDGHTIGMDLADVCKIEVVSCQVQTEAARRGIVGGAAGDDGIVMIEMDIIECQLTVIEMEVGIELLDGLTVRGGVVEPDLTFAVSIRPGAGGFEG